MSTSDSSEIPNGPRRSSRIQHLKNKIESLQEKKGKTGIINNKEITIANNHIELNMLMMYNLAEQASQEYVKTTSKNGYNSITSTTFFQSIKATSEKMLFLLDTLHDFFEVKKRAGEYGFAQFIEQRQKSKLKQSTSSIDLLLSFYDEKLNKNKTTTALSIYSNFIKKFHLSGTNINQRKKVINLIEEKIKDDPSKKNSISTFKNVESPNYNVKRILKNPSVVRLKYFSWYYIIYELMLSRQRKNIVFNNSKLMFDNKSFNAGGTIALKHNQILKYLEQTNSRICIDAMDTSQNALLNKSSLSDHILITPSQVFDAAPLAGISKKKINFYFKDIPLTSSNLSKIKTKAFNFLAKCSESLNLKTERSGREKKIKFNDIMYSLHYQGFNTQIFSNFHFFILKPDGSTLKSNQINQIEYNEFEKIIFFMFNENSNGYLNGVFICKNKKIIKQQYNFYEINKNLYYNWTGLQIAVKNIFSGIGVAELVSIFNLYVTEKEYNFAKNFDFDKAILIGFDYKRSLDNFQCQYLLEMQHFSNNERLFLVTHDYLCCVFAIFYNIDCIFIHQGSFIVFRKVENPVNSFTSMLNKFNQNMKNAATILASLRR